MITTYTTIEAAYKALSLQLISYAKRHLSNQDEAIDCVHNAFSKSIIYLNKNPKSKISSYILYREIIRECRRMNKKRSIEIPTDFAESGILDNAQEAS